MCAHVNVPMFDGLAHWDFATHTCGMHARTHACTHSGICAGQVLDAIESRRDCVDAKLLCSYVEVYGDDITDLLSACVRVRMCACMWPCVTLVGMHGETKQAAAPLVPGAVWQRRRCHRALLPLRCTQSCTHTYTHVRVRAHTHTRKYACTHARTMSSGMARMMGKAGEQRVRDGGTAAAWRPEQVPL